MLLNGWYQCHVICMDTCNDHNDKIWLCFPVCLPMWLTRHTLMVSLLVPCVLRDILPFTRLVLIANLVKCFSPKMFRLWNASLFLLFFYFSWFYWHEIYILCKFRKYQKCLILKIKKLNAPYRCSLTVVKNLV